MSAFLRSLKRLSKTPTPDWPYKYAVHVPVNGYTVFTVADLVEVINKVLDMFKSNFGEGHTRILEKEYYDDMLTKGYFGICMRIARFYSNKRFVSLTLQLASTENQFWSLSGSEQFLNDFLSYVDPQTIE
ncbi:hypothetical protein HDU93_005518, partial [Gonapodya sp. JEL0774]